MAVYKIQYYTTHPKGGWSQTVYDNVLATNEKEAMQKFTEKRPEVKVATIVNWVYIDY